MSFIKICKFCNGKGRIQNHFFPIFKKECHNCKATGKVHVGWDKNHFELKNIHLLEKN